MPHTNIDLEFSDVLGQAHHAHVLTIDGSDWHVHASLEGQSFDKRCGTWQGVERTINWLRRHAHERTPIHGASSLSPVARVACVAVLMLIAATAQAQPFIWVDTHTLAFTAATHEYALMHRRIEQRLGPMQVTDRPETIQRAIDAMAAAIRAERLDARPGDLFTPVLARELRARIDQSLRDHGLTAADVFHAGRIEGLDPAMFTLRVNGAFPWAVGAAMPVCVIGALPALPPELQYRLVGNDLVLVDVHASLIVDILPEALTDLTFLRDPVEDFFAAM